MGKRKKMELRFVRTRSILRNMLRQQYGNRGLRAAWAQYQAENRGKSKTWTEVKYQ